MNYTIKTLLAAMLLSLVTLTATAGVKKVGTINGLDIYRIKNAGVFAPSTTTIVIVDPKKPGTIEGIANSATGPGFVPAVANAGGIAGGAALLRPARSNTNVDQTGGSNANVNAPTSTTTTTVTPGPTTVNNGGNHNHHNGN